MAERIQMIMILIIESTGSLRGAESGERRAGKLWLYLPLGKGGMTRHSAVEEHLRGICFLPLRST
jgi:hypothetical protein